MIIDRKDCVMEHQAIYRKWRPTIFEDIVGQTHITKTLKNQILNNKIGHAYLFCGTRGTGKTTCAKVFSRAVNCLNPHDGSPCNECEICRGILDGSIMDVKEIDAASNNKVEDAREIIDDIRYVASTARYTVYIIDEVHMLSNSAFNALLKTLEEPPEHVIFILATTEAHKVPQTILSRCQRFDFKRIKPSDIILRMKEIAHGDGLSITDEAYAMLAKLADGSMRDGLSILERIVSSCGNTITADDITATLGIADIDSIFNVVDAIIENNVDKILAIINSVLSDGKDLKVFIDNVIKHFRDLLVAKVSNQPDLLLDYSAEEMVKIKAQSEKLTFEKISNAASLLSEAQADAKWVKSPRVIYEMALIKLARPEFDSSPQALMDRLSMMEQNFKGGNIDNSLTERVNAIEEKLKNGVTLQPEPTPEKKNEVKKPVSIKLYNPIPENELTADNPIVQTAKNWTNISRAMGNSAGYLKAALLNRQITIDADGIIMLFNRDEKGSKDIAKVYLTKLQQCFKKASGTDYRIKLAYRDELDDDLIDFWSLKSADTNESKKQENAGDDVSVSPKHQEEDPLDTLMLNFPEIVEDSDESEFVGYNSLDDNFEQSSLVDDDHEEFLDANELSHEDD
ncbi:MAG: DNA polymerase III subunit gamma/tau [Clostridia bacterium]